MRILVLGAGGYLGGHVVRRLRARPGTRVLVGGRSPAADVTADLSAVRPSELARALAAVAPDAVVNCAGATGGDAVHLAEVNARGPAVLCAALREAAPDARLVHLGSAAEYGPGTPGLTVPETAPCAPAGPYGATKLAGTVAVTASGLDAVVLRVGNPVGAGAPPEGLPGRVAGLLAGLLAEPVPRTGPGPGMGMVSVGGLVTVPGPRTGTGSGTATRPPGPDAELRLGDLSAYRDFVDARDVARAVELAATTPGPLPPVLNIGGGQARPVRELVEALADTAGFRGRIVETGDGSARSAQVSWQCSDITEAHRALGWRPVHSLGSSLAELWAARRPARAPEGVAAP
ncbi:MULTISPECIES: NAD-dependent epimerase/dehydratase family protein [unclassified Streptomyces]|uniref:NAD-dependent epimerase/dehydratase family protein n=1 Tax=unclassified Streptomyces TaxID=2593676 RepID=UPI0016612258|nr:MULTISPECIES: NAD(P)-dependent oxidoreductase [unclassified Streptomyces]MBD0709638.1 NarL family transcriptional regulator [Streptomyces sp. CBMA291]MBD0713977.1 NarL family transcriptional regulator [Streptomyces sp. CBMA370]MBD0715238.1 NarL family transcriptional regulator [Streptomyces sp. CBMA370]